MFIYLFIAGKQCVDPGTPPGPHSVQLIPKAYEVGDSVSINCTRPGFVPTVSAPYVCGSATGGGVAFNVTTPPQCVGQYNVFSRLSSHMHLTEDSYTTNFYFPNISFHSDQWLSL